MENDVSALVGKTLTAVDGGQDDDELRFITDTGAVYRMFHDQDCCESVYLEDVSGDLADLVGSPILDAAEIDGDTGLCRLNDYEDSFTWTFYRISTIKGTVVLRWYGTSNGYYSESVDFALVKP